MSNFAFLKLYWADFAKIMEFAENYVYTDPPSSKNKSGLFVELMVREILRIEKIAEPTFDNNHYNRTKLLKAEGILPPDVNLWINYVRKSRNDSSHQNIATEKDALSILGFTWHIAVWFMQVYGDGNFKPEPFVKPQPPERKVDYTRLVVNQEKKISELEAEIAKLLEERTEKSLHGEETPQSALSKKERQMFSAASVKNADLTEEETRELIDMQLRKVGWEVDSKNLRYSKGERAQKNKNRAIAEWDRADYALFVGEKLIGIIEAKAFEKSVYSILDTQCREYAEKISVNEEYLLGTWQKYKVPFVFATNGRPFLKQIETESGIWFQDLRKESNLPKALQGWYSPNELWALYQQNIDEANEKLEQLSYDMLKDKDGLNLRYYQIEAVKAVENAIIAGKDKILLTMATGTGKTRTVLGMIYRFLKTNRFRRILFLVDRTALGIQALDVFKDVKLEDLKPLNDIYNINALYDVELARETKVQVATVQGMLSRIMSDDKKPLSSGDFDCIIIDEAHRGYTLDKELSEAEMLFRDQNDFLSKYKKVIDYFDAVKIALTATPALHTAQIFGSSVYTYSYRDAVIDGYLVDYDAPHIIRTELNQNGIHLKKGEKMPLYNPVTKELLNAEELEDEVDFDVEDFNKKVIAPAFNKTVLEKISKEIDPEGNEKTLIFAVNDRHADEIVKILRDIYKDQDINSQAIEKITFAIGDKERVQNAIKRFKNEHYPTVAVTVDLLSTGIDVPEITKIVFMRRVKSRILYHQMLGRATRLCPKINKTHFDIYDAVDLYSYLDDMSSMKSVVASTSASFADLLSGYDKLEDKEHIALVNEQIIAKMQREKRLVSEKGNDIFSVKTGFDSIEDFISKAKELRKESAEKCRDFLLSNKDAFEAFAEKRHDGNFIPIVHTPDTVIGVERGFGQSNLAPNDYLESFSAYLKGNINKIAAIQIICTKPADLTRAELNTLSKTLDVYGFSELQLNTAVQTVTNEDSVADIISLVRRYAIGSPLVSHEERIKGAVKKLCKAHDFSAGEKKWIDRIEKYLLNESVLNEQTFDESPQWQNQGGFAKVNKIFSNNLSAIIRELNMYLYEDCPA